MRVLDAVADVEAPPERARGILCDLAARAHANPSFVCAGGEVALPFTGRHTP